ncbi:MAG: glycosyltransferase family 87 protein [Acidimicrobiales bacterium]|nr:glycosyltransferase family 87 protein [Acidimicrobiales bacterium]
MTTLTAPAPAAPDERLSRYPKALLGALALAFVLVLVSGSGSDTASGRVGGDFPAFYGAGTIVADGDIDQLWNLEVQQAAQVDLLGDEDGFIMFPYAPHVAAAYAPLSALPYRVAYAVHTALMVGLLVGTLQLLRPLVPAVDRYFPLTLAAVMTAYPVFVGVGGGQNTALSLFLLAAVWRTLHDDREALTGLALALLLFRPQYAIPLVGLLFLGRHWRAVTWAGAGAIGVWLVNTALLGPAWITDWLDGVRPLLEADAEVNAANEIAPIGFLHALWGTESTAALLVGGLVSAAVIAVLTTVWWQGRLALDARFAITTAGLLLVGPHTIYYDSALLLFATLVLLDRGHIDVRIVAGVWALGLVHLGKGVVDASPLAPFVVFAFAAVAVLLARQPEERVLPIQDSWSPR